MVNTEILGEALNLHTSFAYTGDFKKYASVYAFTNENVLAFLKSMNFKGGKTLSVCASGDHILGLLLNGITDIDCFDINLLTKYYKELKFAGIKALSHDEFKSFFMTKSDCGIGIYDKRKLYRMLDLMPDEFACFWYAFFDKSHFNNFSSSGLFLTTGTICDPVSNFSTDYNSTGFIFSKENFYKLKSLIPRSEIKFINSDLLELGFNSESISEKYSNVLLSNIMMLKSTQLFFINI